jgi:glycerophosphoryl diester phosphodiesterase
MRLQTPWVYFTFAAVLLAAAPEEADISKDLQGHRGARGLFPENTIESFRSAIDFGMSTLELDLHYLEKEKRFVVFHDQVVSADNSKFPYNSDLEGRFIHELTLSEVEQLDVGSITQKEFPEQVELTPRAPLLLDDLVDFIETIDPTIGFNIELKLSEPQIQSINLSEAVQLLVQTILSAGIQDRTVIQSFYHPFLVEVKRAYPSQVISALFSPTRFQGLQMLIGLPANRPKLIEKSLEIGAEIISPHHLYCSEDFVSDCHEQGLIVIPWTVNEPDRMIELFRNGVDGIISDYPDRLAASYQQWKNSSN